MGGAEWSEPHSEIKELRRERAKVGHAMRNSLGLTPARAVALTIRLVIVWWAVWALARGVGVVRRVVGPLAVRGAKMRGRAHARAVRTRERGSRERGSDGEGEHDDDCELKAWTTTEVD